LTAYPDVLTELDVTGVRCRAATCRITDVETFAVVIVQDECAFAA
jgi:hypothetical protein